MTTTTHTGVFGRVVCGVDGSEEGLTAARAAALVTDPEGELTLVTVLDRSVAVHAGWGMSQVLEELGKEAARALEAGEEVVRPLHDAGAILVEGESVAALLGDLEQRQATLAVVGSHGFSRPAGVALRSVATYLLHEARCSVLVARGDVAAGRWPRRIVVGVDGSPDSALAYEAARALADRYDASIRVVACTEDARVDLDAVRRVAPDCELHDARALDVLDVLSESADLVVVGSRGLRGFRALGSLGERLAHDARCSVLVVRAAPTYADERSL